MLFCKQIEHFPPRKPFLIYILIIKLQGDIIKHKWKRNIFKKYKHQQVNFCLISEQSELDINNRAYVEENKKPEAPIKNLEFGIRKN